MAGLLDLLMSSLSAPATSQGGKMGVSGSGAPTSAPSQTDSQGNVVVTAPPPGALPMGGLPAALTAQRQEASAPQGNAIPPLTNDAPSPINQAPDQSSHAPMVNYNNSQDAQAATQATTGYSGLDSNDPQKGLYGLLPSSLQHGTMRNVLGALGDAFLIHAGAQPEYAPRLQREQLGQAMAGLDINNPDSVQAAASRVAASGVPGAAEMADKIQEQGTQAALKRQIQEQNTWFQRSRIDDQHDNIFARSAGAAQGAVAGAVDKNDYAARYAVLDRRAKMVDPSTDAATAYGVPTPDEWTPGQTNYGQTSNQQVQHSDRVTTAANSVSNNIRNNATKIQGDTILANGRTVDANISVAKPSDAGILQSLIDKQNSGEPLSPAETTVWHRLTDPPKGRRPSPGATPPPPAPPSGEHPSVPGPNGPVNLPKDQQGNYVAGPHPMTDQQAATLPSGHNIHFLSAVDGKWHYRP